MAATGVGAHYGGPLGTRPHRTAWEAEATLHVKIGGGRRAWRTGYAVAAVAALLLGLGIGTILPGGRPDVASHVATGSAVDEQSATIARTEDRADPPTAASDAEADAVAVADAAHVAEEAAPAAVVGASVAAATVSVPSVLLARLESIVSLDGIRRASFRVGDRSIALVEGDQLGGRAVAEIADEDVTLVGGDDGPRRVRLGFETPVE
jgi:hypothetical protein